MKALVIANGSVKDIQFYKEQVVKGKDYDLILCADGGMNNCLKLGLIPNIVIGDFDSIHNDSLDYIHSHDIEMIRYPKEKDKTDTELVLDYLIERNYKHITLIGCIGDRVDHSLANISLLKKLLDNGVLAYIVDEKNIITLINSEVTLENHKGKTVSLLPYSNCVKGVTTFDLYYPLKDHTLYRESSYGISNIILSDLAKVKVSHGDLLIIISRD